VSLEVLLQVHLLRINVSIPVGGCCFVPRKWLLAARIIPGVIQRFAQPILRLFPIIKMQETARPEGGLEGCKSLRIKFLRKICCF
jgi:hypothetical protein